MRPSVAECWSGDKAGEQSLAGSARLTSTWWVVPVGRTASGLPAEATSFVGRRRDLAEVKRLVSSARLVTLTGTAGVGKTRLALRVADDLAPTFPGGVRLAELSGLREPELVPDTVMMALGVDNRPGWSAIDTVVDHVRGKRLLLVLDNCEHLVEACATFAYALLRADEDVRILTTSRRPLGMVGEHLWPVSPLPVPDPHRPLPGRSSPRRAALALLEERAARVAPGRSMTRRDRAAMAGICRRLDGLPLALELAAVQLRNLSPRQVLDGLDDRFGLLAGHGRRELLRATLDWSFGLCTPDERTLWSRLSVFAGSFDLEEVEDVCAGDGIEPDDVIDILSGLVDKSVVVREQTGGDVRFRLLETVGEYGLDKLRQSGGETALRIRHRDHYLRLAETAMARWFGPEQMLWLARARLGHADLRAALEFSRTTPGQARAGLRLAAALWFYWAFGSLLAEGRRWLEQLLLADPRPSPERVDALWAAGYIAGVQGEVPVGSVFFELSRVLAVELGDDSAQARALSGLGMVALLSDDNHRAIELEDRALAKWRQPGVVSTDSSRVLARLWFGAALVYEGELDKGVEVCEEGRSLSEARGEKWTLAWFRYVLARAALASGAPERALAHARHGLHIHRAFRDTVGVAISLELLAWIVVAGGDRGERAAVLLGAAHHAWVGFGVPGFGASKSFIAPHRECETAVRDALGEQAFERAFRRGTRLTLDQAVDYALAG
ncbi:MAG TPA: LuxR family transcriptional regulator [Amycolatopsis sp.]|uniref:ATP-binding protein n=1 Tax=Amycolatopsis sp. TaxID=37632 RepID=UPI002B470386|nr:LuxR family transcriptional regulator [Amycolatopsis sp.]HKS47058.1 LuxR family transcriptional regulator [Amycolatopsis sp.]